jgi:NAD(P)H-dependent FMN reductase
VLSLQLIIGSTRDGRASDLVQPWLERRIAEHGAFELQVLDLRDWPLPMYQETLETIGDRRNPTYSDPLVKRWNDTIAAGDVFVFLTPEYNHSITGVLKNAIDSVFVSYGFRNKVTGAVSYSGGIAAGVRAIEHLAHIVIETDAMPLRNSVIIPRVRTAFEDDVPKDPMTDAALTVMLDDLAWWGTALQRARAEGELAPGTARLYGLTSELAPRRAEAEAAAEAEASSPYLAGASATPAVRAAGAGSGPRGLVGRGDG